MTKEFLQMGATRCDEEAVRMVGQPGFTKTWHPFGHNKVLDATWGAIDKLNLTVVKKEFSLSAEGKNMFGLIEVENGFGMEGKNACIGVRNSINKAMSLGFCFVLRVIKCLNQVSDSDYVLLRKHTGNLEYTEIKTQAVTAIEQVLERAEGMNQWHEGLREYSLTQISFDRLTIRAMRRKVLAPSKFHEFDGLVAGPEADYDRDLHGFHGGLTQLIRDRNMIQISLQNRKITEFMNEAVTRLR